jgi:NADPH2:quinone reductase
MLAAWYDAKGSARDVLRVGELPDPEPGRDEVRVRVFASGVNPTDTKARGGWRGNTQMPFPRVVPHQDGAGVIDRVGPGVDAARLGERVWIYEAQWQRPSGTGAQLVCVRSTNAVALPEGVSFEEGACLGIPAMTAHECVSGEGSVAGKTVLVSGAAGAVGYFAVQLARLGGARVLATVGSEAQARLVATAGAHTVIDRAREDVRARVLDETEGRGVDRIVEVAFGPNVATDAAVLAPGATLATYASDAEHEPRLPFYALMLKNVTIRFVLIYLTSREAHAAQAQAIGSYLAQGKLRFSIARTFPLEDVAAAHEAVEAGHLGGKVLVTLPR